MKRTVGILAGMAALGVVVYVGSRLWAQAQPPPTKTQPAPAATKVGMVNIPLVIKSYQKFKVYEGELQDLVKPMQAEDDKLRKELIKYQNALKDPKYADKQAEYQKVIRDIQRQIEDLAQEAKLKVNKKSEEHLVALYKEVNTMVEAYAKANGFHLVLQYTEPIKQEDVLHPDNIKRKLMGGGCMPMYSAQGLDISQAVVDNLNRWYQRVQAQQPATPAGKR